MELNGFILAAGRGTRFQQLALTTPKPLVEVGGKPLINYSLEKLRGLGAKEITINTFHLAEKIHEGVGDGSAWGTVIHYSDETDLLGSAGGYRLGWELYDTPRTTVILSSDIVTNIDISKVVDFHKNKKAEFTVAVLERDDVTGSGIVQFDANNKITRYFEKPTSPEQIFSHWVNGSIYVVEPSVINYMSPIGTFADFSKDLFPELIRQQARFYAYQLPKAGTYLMGVDSPELKAKVEYDIVKLELFNEQTS